MRAPRARPGPARGRRTRAGHRVHLARRRRAPRASRAGARARARATRASPCGPRPGAARTTSSSTSRPCSSRPACGSSSSSRRGSRASAIGERQPPALALRQPAVRDSGDPLQADPLERGVGVGGACDRSTRVDEAHVLGDGEVVVAERLVADERDRAADAPAARPRDRRRAPQPAPTRSGNSPAQSRSSVVLPGAVRPAEQHDLARLDLEVGARERGKSSEHANGRPKAYDSATRALRDRGAIRRELYEGRRAARRTAATACARTPDHAPVPSPACDARSRPSAGRW